MQVVEKLEALAPAAFGAEAGAKYVGLARTRFFYLMKEGKIPSFKIGARRLVLRADLDEFINKAVEQSRSSAQEA